MMFILKFFINRTLRNFAEESIGRIFKEKIDDPRQSLSAWLLPKVLFYQYDATKRDLIVYSSAVGWCEAVEMQVQVKNLINGVSTHQLWMKKTNKFSNVLEGDTIFRIFYSKFPETVAVSLELHFNVRYIPILSENYEIKPRDPSYCEQLWSAAVEEYFSDVKFKVGAKIFPAHRALLVTRCPVLAALVPSSHSIARLDDVDPVAFKDILYFLYTGVLRTNPLDSNRVFAAARTYKIDTLLNFRQYAPMNWNRYHKNLTLFITK